MAGSHKLMDATVPRPAPRFGLVPTPFNFEKPSPQVPDISLIFDSSASSSSPLRNTSQMTNLSSSIPTSNVNGSSNCGGRQANSFEVQVLYDMMKKQEETISKMSSQIQLIIESQGTRFDNLQSALLKVTASLPTPVKMTDQCVQTDKVQDNEIVTLRQTQKEQQQQHKVSLPSPTPVQSHNNNNSNNIDNNKLPNIERSRNSSSSGGSSTSNRVNNNNNRPKGIALDPQNMSPFTAKRFQQQQQQSHNSETRHDPIQDLSTILKDLQLPTIQEASVISEASVHALDLQDYNDSMDGSDLDNARIGPSVSAYGSSSDEEEEIVQPTATFYRNVIGNVNRMLENQETTLYGSSDTTVYGMSSSHLSFATKQYLQKYGLVKPKIGKENKNAETNRVFGNEELPASNRVLDMAALKNQPKLL